MGTHNFNQKNKNKKKMECDPLTNDTTVDITIFGRTFQDNTFYEGREVFHFTQILVAFISGLLIGVDRTYRKNGTGKAIVFVAVCGTACLVGIVSQIGIIKYCWRTDPTRMAGAVVSSLGFPGSGFVMATQDVSTLRGLTHAGFVWSTCAFGIAIAYRYFICAISLLFLHLASSRIANKVETGSFFGTKPSQ